MQKWEYCVLTGVKVDSIGTFEGHYPKLYFFTLNGLEKEVDLGKASAKSRPKGWEKVSEGGYIAHVIAQLGCDGWEMTCTGSQSPTTSLPPASHCLYFRRPLEQP